VEAAQHRVVAFYEWATAPASDIESYVDALNRRPPLRMWWAAVAHPELEALWRN
jgi:hypothetical protein